MSAHLFVLHAIIIIWIARQQGFFRGGGAWGGGGGGNKPSLAICFQVEEEAIGNRGTKFLLTWMHSLSRDQ